MKKLANKNGRGKNKLLTLGLPTIPYLKELKSLNGITGTNACILFQQLEYWSHIMGGRFYKFQAPPETENHSYIDGSSWVEELGLSEDEFRTAYKQLGVRYKSKKEFSDKMAVGDVFEGKYYCSYFDKVSRLTHYIRNDSLVEEAISKVAIKDAKGSTGSHETGNANLTNASNTFSTDSELDALEDDSSESQYHKTNQDTKNNISNERDALSAVSKIKSTFGIDSCDISFDVKELEGDCPGEFEKIKIPIDFEPSIDYLYRAANTFKKKSPSYVTEKFIGFFREKGTKKTPKGWQHEWWNWMNRELSSNDNSQIEDELNEIILEANDLLWEAVDEIEFVVWEVDDLLEKAIERGFSIESVSIFLKTCERHSQIGHVEGYYFDRLQCESSDNLRNQVIQWLLEQGFELPDYLTDKLKDNDGKVGSISTCILPAFTRG